MNNPDFTKTGNSVWNQPFVDYMKQWLATAEIEKSPEQADVFLDVYPKWIASSKLNKFTGLDAFPNRFVSLGVTQAMDWWHYWTLSEGRNFKMFRGEYPYNRDVWLGEEILWEHSIDDTGIQPGDSVIVSVPFSGHGRKHDKWDWLMSECNLKNVPVFVDCAWFGTCFDIEVNLDEPCIKQVGFSTGKGLSCGNWRSGIVFDRLGLENNSLAVQTEWKHGIHLNVAIAVALMNEFGPDSIPKKYMISHKMVCEHYGFDTTNTVHIAEASNQEQWNEFHRDGVYNRINIAKAIKRHKSKGSFYE